MGILGISRGVVGGNRGITEDIFPRGAHVTHIPSKKTVLSDGKAELKKLKS
jgi:hypothetical protein